MKLSSYKKTLLILSVTLNGITPQNNNTFIHSVFCLTTGPKPPPKWFLHIVRSRASSFKWKYPLLSLRSSSSFLRLLPRLLATSISPFIFPSITCFRRQFLRKMWPTQLAFRFLISCRIFPCSLTLSNISSFLTWSDQLIFSILLQHHIIISILILSFLLSSDFFLSSFRIEIFINFFTSGTRGEAFGSGTALQAGMSLT